MQTGLLKVRIISPKKDIFAGNALSVSSVNSEGKFDILPEHANFITVIQKSPIIVKTAEKTLTFTFPLAVIHTQKDIVNIYTELSTSL